MAVGVSVKGSGKGWSDGITGHGSGATVVTTLNVRFFVLERHILTETRAWSRGSFRLLYELNRTKAWIGASDLYDEID